MTLSESRPQSFHSNSKRSQTFSDLIFVGTTKQWTSTLMVLNVLDVPVIRIMTWNSIVTCRADRSSSSSLRNTSPASRAGKAERCTADKAEHRWIMVKYNSAVCLSNFCPNYLEYDTYSYNWNEQVFQQEVLLVERREKGGLKKEEKKQS